MSDFYYLIRSKVDGAYVAAHPKLDDAKGFLLMFKEDFDALSYLNTHAKDVADKFAVESVSSSQVKSLLKRWGFAGVGIVQDPLVPRVEFLVQE
ncbi:MAG TPA: hypothetical protein V6D13_11810 [Halomicronema sp.]